MTAKRENSCFLPPLQRPSGSLRPPLISRQQTQEELSAASISARYLGQMLIPLYRFSLPPRSGGSGQERMRISDLTLARWARMNPKKGKSVMGLNSQASLMEVKRSFLSLYCLAARALDRNGVRTAASGSVSTNPTFGIFTEGPDAGQKSLH